VIDAVRRWVADHLDLRPRLHHLRLLPAAVVAVALLTLLVRNADTPALPDYEVPAGFDPAPAPTTAPPGAERPSLAAVDGTTTSLVPPNVGRSRLSGVVTGPAGPVPGAVVRLERAIGGVTQVLDVLTGPDGRYDAPNIGGGRYRVRAFLAPLLAQPRGTLLFLTDGEDRPLDLAVAAFGEPSIALAVAPNPPLLDQPLNAAVRVSGRLVDADGVVRTQPLVGGRVTISASDAWVPTSSTNASTDGSGEARFGFECRSTAPTRVQVSVRVPVAVTSPPPDPSSTTTTTDPSGTTSTTSPPTTITTATFDVPACVDPATLTTTTTTPPDGSTTSSSPDASSTSTTSTTAP